MRSWLNSSGNISGPGLEYSIYVNPSRYSSIQQAVDEAVLLGASAAKIYTLYVSGFGWQGDIALADGIAIVGGQGGELTYQTRFDNCTISFANSTGSTYRASLNGIVCVNVSGKKSLNVTGTGTIKLYINNCDIQKTAGSEDVITVNNAAATLSFYNCILDTASTATGVVLNVVTGIILMSLTVMTGIANSCITIAAGSLTCGLSQFNATGADIVTITGTPTCTFLLDSMTQNTANQNGINATGNSTVTLSNILFNVAASVTANAFKGILGGVLVYGPLYFLPSTNTRVSITTMGAGALAITSVPTPV